MDLLAYERRFRRDGLPLLIEDYSASEDVFNRAVPILALVFLAEVLGAVKLEWSLAANLAALTGGLAIALATIALLNRARGRPVRAVPQSVGVPELAAFVLVPAALPLIFGFQPLSAGVTAVGNLAVLALVYGVIGFGLLSIVRWALGQLLGQLRASLVLLTRALPLLLIFALVLLFTTEMWQVFGSVSRQALVAIGVLFVIAGAIFLVARLPREVERLEHDAGGEGPALSGRQLLNVGLVMFISQALQVVVVTLAIGAFFVAFGMLAITPEVRDTWTGSHGHVILGLNLLGERVELSEELLRVSGAIAAFSGLYYAIAVLTDSTYREEFLDELTSQMRSTFQARADYLRLRAETSRL